MFGIYPLRFFDYGSPLLFLYGLFVMGRGYKKERDENKVSKWFVITYNNYFINKTFLITESEFF